MIENRKFIRLQAPIGVVYKVSKKHKRQRAQLSHVKDMSGGGIKILAKEDLRHGDLLEIQIQIPHLEEAIHAMGEVVWFSHTKGRDREFREAGVRFRDIAPEDLHKILEYVHEIGIG